MDQANRLGIGRQIGGYTNIKSHPLQIYAQIKMKIFLLLTVILVLIIMLLVEYGLVNQIYFANYQRKIAIKRIMGRQLWRIHANFAGIWLIIMLLEWCVSTSVYGVKDRLMIIFLAMIILQLMIFTCQAFTADKRISKAIKGED
ncbi:DUF1430 domain-containing protein [Oenococcus sicerae]|uniref:DUF1430 domain-containing protein n=1 Tax=Oenococcus sicerae TaxID=2203724 RepID=UPI0010B5C730|nr:hypothetical protein OAL24_01617 [Oenococcus sicerae]